MHIRPKGFEANIDLGDRIRERKDSLTDSVIEARPEAFSIMDLWGNESVEVLHRSVRGRDGCGLGGA